MVKIKDLSDDQIAQQIKKYKKILDELERENSRRFPEKKEETESRGFQLEFNDDELSEIEKIRNSGNEGGFSQEEQEVRVTRLLNLSKEQLDNLQNGKAKLKKKVSKKKIKKS